MTTELLRPIKNISIGGTPLIFEVSVHRGGVTVRNNKTNIIGRRKKIGYVTPTSYTPNHFPSVVQHTDEIVAAAREYLEIVCRKKRASPILENQNIVRKINMQVGKCYLVRVTESGSSAVHLIKSNLRKDLAIRLLTHATGKTSRVFGQATVTLMNGISGDIDNFYDHVDPGIFVQDGTDGRYFCLLCNRNEALEVLREYREDPRYNDDCDGPDCYQHQMADTIAYKEVVDRLATLIGERWPSKDPSAVTEPEIAKPTKADFIRANPTLSVAGLVQKAAENGIDLQTNYIYALRASDKRDKSKPKKK
jgi:hypothetical protein